MSEKKESLSIANQWRSVWFAFVLVLKNARLYTITSFGYAVISGLAPIAQAYFAGSVFSELARIPLGSANKQRLIIFVIASAFLSAVNFALSNLSNTLFNHLRESLAARLNGALLEKYAQLKLEMLEMPDVKEKFEKAGAGMREVIWVTNSTANLASALISIVGALALVVRSSPWLTIVFLPLPFITVSMRMKSQQLRRDSWKATRVERMRMNAIQTMFTQTTGVIELRLYGLVKKFVKLWHKDQKLVLDRGYKDDMKSAKFNLLIEFAESLIGVCVDVWLVVRVFAGLIGVGIFEQTRRLVGTYVSSLGMLSSTLGNIAADTFSLNDYRLFVQSELDASILRSKTDLVHLDTEPKSFQLTDAEFTYPKAEKPTVQIKDLHLSAHEHIALAGENGAGKTTLLKLLLGLYEPTKGSVLINGVDTRQLDDEALAQYVSPLMQDFSEFDFLTVKESVAVGEQGRIDDDRVIDVLQIVGLLDYFNKQPKKLDSTLGWAYDDSLRLSGGQWQRLAIARALYKRSPIIILDEPTSAIDAKSEQDIIDAIFDRYKDKMVIVVSHRMSTVKRAKRILVLKDGQIAEDGTHKELFRHGTVYYDLFGRQANAMKDDV